MMQFGLSTHLFHNERLERAHLDAIAAAGFTAIEIFATRTHVDYHDRRRLLEIGAWLREAGLEAVSMHAPICDSFVGGAWGRAYSNASPRPAVRQEALDETLAALDAVLDRWPNVRLGPDATPPAGLVFRKPARLPVRWDP